MSNIPQPPDNWWKLTIHYHMYTRPDDEWTNTLEYNFAAGTDPRDDFPTMSGDMANELVAALLDDVVVDRFVWSVWSESGNRIYNPDELVTVPIGIRGSRVASGTPDPLDVVLYYRKQTVTGRPGRMALRGALVDADVETNAGQRILTAGGNSHLADVNAALNTAFVLPPANGYGGTLVIIGAPLVDILYPATPEGTKQVPQKVYGAPTVRPVTSFQFMRVGTLDRTQNTGGQ